MRRTLLLLALLSAHLPTLAAERPASPEEDATLINAGFLDSHPDIMYRQWGVGALHRNDVKAAMDHFRRAARYADKPAQGYLGEMYWFGVDQPRDPVMAFAWMDVAAERGYPLFAELRDEYWATLPLEQHQAARAQAQALRAEYGDAVARPRMADVLRKGRREMTGSRTGSMSNNVDVVFMDGGISRTIKADRLYDPKYWDPKQYERWQDETWMKIRRGTVQVGVPTQSTATEAKP
ncbi:TPA: sel1 repeat family protein [Stenotrophomonas maltophilia]|uniref:Sel1 repeat family protein n=1 Tax=Stenotrophomonas maltophilia TaxID=40324 RepID=A0AAJ2JC91_STEMA|nr:MULTISPECIES: sel1 repeat family protein [Stenotrophomonas]MBH1365161.1 sel1 repeat family protein [Stenotrophomonas maltophilia]MDQ7282795.1 sel1 repeat family protein [Stenotrophomonas sp. Sm6012]MDT3467272.1 sel1 repeat family protein [Stenotrophomonas maltophilia]HEL3180064.1 sel1 repeat family protein [Stenotrophomonas maltophilia]